MIMAIKLRLVLFYLPLILFHSMLVAPIARGKNQDYDFDDLIEDSPDGHPVQTNTTLEIKQKENTNRSLERSGASPTNNIHRWVLISILVHSKSKLNHRRSGRIGKSAKNISFHQSRLLRKKRSDERYRSTGAEDNGGTSDLNNLDPYERLFLSPDQRTSLLDRVTDAQRSSSSNTKAGDGNYRRENTGSYYDYHKSRDDRYRHRYADTYDRDGYNGDYSRNGNVGSSSGGTNDRYKYRTDRYRTDSNHNLYYNRENTRYDSRSTYNNNGRDSYSDRNYRNERSQSNNNNDRYLSRDEYYSKNYNPGSYSSRYNDRFYRNDRKDGYSDFGRDSNSKSSNEYRSYYNRYDQYKGHSDINDRTRYNDNRYDSDRSGYSDRSSKDNYRNRYNDYTDNGNDYRRNSHTKQDIGDRHSSRYDDLYDDRKSYYNSYYNRNTDRRKSGPSNYDSYRQRISDSYIRDRHLKRHEQKPAYPDTLYNDLSLPTNNRDSQDYSSADYRSPSSGSGRRDTSDNYDRRSDRENKGYKNDYFYRDGTRSSPEHSGKDSDYKRSYKHKSVSSRRYLDTTFSNHTEQDGENGSKIPSGQQPYVEAYNIFFDRVPNNGGENRSSGEKEATNGYGPYQMTKERALFNVKTRFKRQAPGPSAGGYQYNNGYNNQERSSAQFQNGVQYGQSYSHQRLSYPSPSADGRYAPLHGQRSYSEQHRQPDYSSYQNAEHTYQPQPYQTQYDQRAYNDNGFFNRQNPYGRAEYANYDTSGRERAMTPYNTPSTYQQTPHNGNPYNPYSEVSRYSPNHNPEYGYNPYSQPINSHGNNAGTGGGYGDMNGNYPQQGISYPSQHPVQPHQQQGQEYSPYYNNRQQGLYNSRERGGYSPHDQSQGSNYGIYDQRQVAYDPYTSGGQDNTYGRSPYQAQQNSLGPQGYQGHQNSEYASYNY